MMDYFIDDIGRLVITCEPGYCEEYNVNSLSDVFDSELGLLGNGWGFLSPQDVGALSDAPIIGDEVCYSDDGSIETTGNVYYYADYAIYDPVEMLNETGKLFFRKA